MILPARFWSSATVLLCALLFQNCQSSFLNATEEDGPAGSSSAVSIRRRAFSEPPDRRSLTSSSAYPAGRISLSHFAKAPTHKKDSSAVPSFRSLRLPEPYTRPIVSNPSAAPYHLPAAAMPRASRAVPLGNNSGYAPSLVFAAASGEYVRFGQIDGRWYAAVQAGYRRSPALQYALPVVGPADVGNFLFWLQGQDQCASRGCIHILRMPQAPYGSYVYLGRSGLWREAPSDEAKNAKPPAQQRSSDLDNELAKRNKPVRAEERRARRCRRDALNILLAMARHEPDKAAQFLDVLLVAAQDKAFRRQTLEALGNVSKASSDMFSECLPSLHAAAKKGDKDVRLLALKTLGEVEWKHYFGEVEPAPDLPREMTAILDSTCPFWPGRKIRDTHLLVLIPATVDGAPFTLNLLGELIKRPKNGGYETRYTSYNKKVKERFGEESHGRSYWILMTHDVLEDSRSKDYSAQKALVARYTGSDGQPYEIPEALEAATAILMHHGRTGVRLFTGARLFFDGPPWTYTRCQELMDVVRGKCPVVVGGFESAPAGLRIVRNSRRAYCASYGVAGCRKFKEERHKNVRSLTLKTFGEAEWEHYFGKVEPAPDLPREMTATLDSTCPFWPGRKIRDTHLLVLIPATVDGEPFTLNLLGELIERPKNSVHKTKYERYSNKVKAQLGEKSPYHSYWLLMTRDVLEDSRSKDYSAQSDLVADRAEKAGQPYEIPSALEVATAVLTHHVRGGERILGGWLRTYTRCQVLADGKLAVVGGFEPAGLRVVHNFRHDCCTSYGVVGCRRFEHFGAKDVFFGTEAWKHYFGEVGPAPDLPSDLATILDNACPFWPGKKVRDTHLLVLIPAKINGRPYSLNLLRELVQHPKAGGHGVECRYHDSNVQEQIGATSPPASYWLLMTRDVLPESRSKTYVDQKKLIADHARRTSLPYEVPKALEAATTILTHYVRNRDRERLYSDDPWTFTRCQESISYQSEEYPTVVGGFESSGLYVSYDSDDDCFLSGVAGCREF
jgi:hypothetical protein